jgi:membrane fusion protein, multidrug efflux system
MHLNRIGNYIYRPSIALIAFIFSILISCRQNQGEVLNPARVISVEAFRVHPEKYSVSIRATGNLMSFEETELRTPVSGNVLNIHFQEGQYVNRGALLVEIDNRSWSAQKKGLEAQLAFAESDLTRKKDLIHIEGVSQEELEQSHAQVSNLNAQIEELDVMIDLAHIRAPFSGRLGMRNFSPGTYLSQGEIITRLVQSHILKVSFSVPARYASLVRKDQEVKIISSASADTAFAVIYAIDPTISTASRSLQIRALLDNKDQRYVAGDFAQVIYEVEQVEEALLVPAESVIPELNTQVVYLAKDGKAVRREIATGSRTHDRVQVLNGISAGDYVLTTGLMEIRDGDQIEIRVSNPEEPL